MVSLGHATPAGTRFILSVSIRRQYKARRGNPRNLIRNLCRGLLGQLDLDQWIGLCKVMVIGSRLLIILAVDKARIAIARFIRSQ